VHPKESNGFTSGACQMNPGFTVQGVAMNTESGIAHVGIAFLSFVPSTRRGRTGPTWRIEF